MQWQTNHNATADAISLTRRKGWLSIQALPAERMEKARNQLVQKTMGYESEATVCLALDGLTPGQRIGMGLLGGIKNGAGVMKAEDGSLQLYFDEIGHAHPQPVPLLQANGYVWIRLTINAPRQQHQFSYSLDGKHFTPIGTCFREWSHGWKGTHISLFTYTTSKTSPAGIAYFDDFVYKADGKDC